MDEKIIRYFLIIAAMFALLTYGHDLLKDFVTSEFDDVGHYYICARLLREGHDIWAYNAPAVRRADEIFRTMGTTENQYYRPAHSGGFFLLFMPFTYLPYRYASVLWVVWTQCAFLLSLMLIARSFSISFGSWKLLATVFFAFSMWALREEMHFGQPNLLVLFFLSLGLYFWKKKYYAACGFSIALCVTTKEMFLPVALFFLVMRNSRALIACVSGLLALKIIPLILFGWSKELSYLQYHYFCWISSFARGTMSISFSEGLRRVISNVAYEHYIRIAIICLNLCLVSMVVAWFSESRKKNRSYEPALLFSLLLLLSVLTSPWLRETHLVVVIFSILVAWYSLSEKESIVNLSLFACAYILVCLKYSVQSFSPFLSGVYALAGGLKIMGCLVLFYLTGRLLSRKRESFKC